jgi:hypothetical protein
METAAMIDRCTKPSPTSGTLALAAALAICAAPAGAKSLPIPAGTALGVNVMRTVSSHNARVGDRFTFKVARPVIVGGFVIVRQGTLGQGEVIKSEGAGRNGKPGKLGLRFHAVPAVDGSAVVLSAAPSTADAQGRRGTTAAIATATRLMGSASLLLGPGSLLISPVATIARSVVGSIAGHFTWGHDVTVDPKQLVSVFVSHDVRVAVKRSRSGLAAVAFSRVH